MALRREAEVSRNRRGFHFGSARRVALLYLDSDEPAFNRIRLFAKSLKEEYKVSSVISMGYVDAQAKHLPVWQQKKLEYDFICRDDLNWYLKPVRNVRGFLDPEFDILIDLSGGEVIPLAFLLRESRAAMKVGWKGSLAGTWCDLTIAMKDSTTPELFIQQLKLYLGNSTIS